MNIEIFKNEELLNVKDSISVNYADNVKIQVKVLPYMDINFESIAQLKGEKKLMDLAFQHTKKELI